MQFWEGIWSVEAKHNPRASFIEKVRTEVETVEQQKDQSVTVNNAESVFN